MAIETSINAPAATMANPQEFSLESGKIRKVALFVGLNLVELGDVTIHDLGKSEGVSGGEAQ